MLPLFRDVDDHGDAHAGVVKVALAAWSRAAVVAVVENDGVISEAVFLELGEDAADFGIEGRHGVVVDSEVMAHLGEVREIGREVELGWIEAWSFGDEAFFAVLGDL